MAKLLKKEETEVDFSPEVNLFFLMSYVRGKKLVKMGSENGKIGKIFQKMTNFLGISTGSSFISAGSQLFFQNFLGFTRLVAKSW